MKRFTLFALSILIVSGLVLPTTASAHRSGCHRWHSCPSDTGSYVCGDLGYTSGCPKKAVAPVQVKKTPAPKVAPVDTKKIVKPEQVKSAPASKKTWVNGYYRKNGTYVSGYWRN